MLLAFGGHVPSTAAGSGVAVSRLLLAAASRDVYGPCFLKWNGRERGSHVGWRERGERYAVTGIGGRGHA